MVVFVDNNNNNNNKSDIINHHDSFSPSHERTSSTRDTTTTTLIIRRHNNEDIHQKAGYVRSNVIYGHVHIPKTGGTNLNGRLAAQYERVCGNKGNSYDYFQYNQRATELGYRSIEQAGGNTDLIARATSTLNNKKKQGGGGGGGGGRSVDSMIAATLSSKKGKKGKTPQYNNRGRLPLDFHIMDEVGYEDCDYISMERHWRSWLNLFPKYKDLNDSNNTTRQASISHQLDYKLELHVPCRDPVDHLMSSCNYQKRRFNCEKAIENRQGLLQQINKCLMPLLQHQWSTQLRPSSSSGNKWNKKKKKKKSGNTSTSPLTAVKCFRAFPQDAYLEYMGQFLQERRYPALPYFDRTTNRPRTNRTQDECIWTNPTLVQQVHDILVGTNNNSTTGGGGSGESISTSSVASRYSWYRFCQRCLGSELELNLSSFG